MKGLFKFSVIILLFVATGCKKKSTGPGNGDSGGGIKIETGGKLFGGSRMDNTYSVQQTSDGGYIIAGETEVYHPNDDVWSWNAFILKLNSDGSQSWIKNYGDVGTEIFYSIQQTSDGEYIAGGHVFSTLYPSGAWIVKLNVDGSVNWEKVSNNDVDAFFDIDETSDGGYIAAGVTSVHPDGFRDLLVWKLDKTGNIEFSKSFIREHDQIIFSIQECSEGGYVLAGFNVDLQPDEATWVIRLDQNLDIVWEKNLRSGYTDGNQRWVQQTSDGGFIVSGGVYEDGKLYPALWKLDNSGNIEWEKIYRNFVDGWANSVCETQDGGLVACGFSRDYGLVFKVDNKGELKWGKLFDSGLNGYDELKSVAPTRDGGVISAGIAESDDVNNPSEIWVIKLDAQGNSEW